MRLTRLDSWVIVPLLAVVSLGAGSDRRLIEAAKEPDKLAVRALLKQKVDVNARDGDGATALHWAARWDDLESADLLIAAGADVNAADDLGGTPLWVACAEASASMVDRLLRAGAKPNVALMSGETPLMAASHVGNLNAVKSLLIRGADVNTTEHGRGQTALMWATAERHANVVEALVEVGANVHARSAVRPFTVSLAADLARNYDKSLMVEIPQGGYTPMLFAAQQGDIDSARVLLAGGANVNDVAPVGTSALVVAAHNGHGRFGAFLLEKGADPNAADAGYTALHAAILRRDVPLVRALITHGAKLNTPVKKATPARRGTADYALTVDMIGGTPFWLAARFSEPDIMSVLAAGGADPKFVMQDGTTTLMAPMTSSATGRRDRMAGPVITERMTLDAMKAAADLGIDIHAANAAGDTALHIAVSKELDTVIRFLADRGARLEVKNNKGQTPLALATVREAAETMALLRKLGAKE
jgi:ankyrin repeat protein